MAGEARVLGVLAAYNERTNTSLGTLLGDHVMLVEDPGSTWYGSVLGMLSHIAIADLVWLKRTWLPRFDTPPAFAWGYSGVGDALFNSFGEWRDGRAELDRLIVGFCDGLSDEELSALVTYRNTSGAPFSQPRWQLLLHMFNHQTHHRGGIAQLLDERGLSNDFSNLVWYLRDGAIS